MTETAIAIRDLGKMYRLYKHPADKVLDAFGFNNWLFWRKQYYQEFWALRGLNIEIKKGERLGLIGSNGAGKSTFLKIITGNIMPTEGTVEVQGRVQALMELGTGFHPEFTGRQNIQASLAYQGLSSGKIKDMEEEIIDFAELDEFIDQPIKTYSAGMYARLAFSTATSVQPEILIIDEILGAGDAYFTGKCVERMKKLTEESGATVLFVSHDLSSVEMLCDRCLWIERGIKKMDGATSQVSKGYAQMIRELTEKRLRAKNAMVSANSNQSTLKLREKSLQLILRFVCLEGLPIEISLVKLLLPGFNPFIVKVGEPQDNFYGYDSFVLIDYTSSLWGNPVVTAEEMHYRPITTNPGCGSAIVFNIDGLDSVTRIEVSIKGRGYRGSKARLEFFDGFNYNFLTNIEVLSNVDSPDPQWLEWTGYIESELIKNFMNANNLLSNNINSTNTKSEVIAQELSVKSSQKELENNKVSQENAITIIDHKNSLVNNISGEIFKGKILIEKVSFTNDLGFENCVFKSFETLFVNIDYLVLGESIEAEFVVCIHRIGIIVLQALSGIQHGKTILKKGDTGRFTLKIPSLPLGNGSYLVSIGIFPAINYQSQDTERTAYILQDRRYEIHIEQPESIAIDLGMCRAKLEWIHRL